MSTYDFTNGNIAGLQMQAGALVGVNFFEVDFAEVIKAYPALANGDIITVGILPKGANLNSVCMETLTASQAGASNLTLQDDTGTPVVILDSHDPTTAGTLSGPKAGTTTLFGGGTATGLHNIFLTAAKKLNILVGATVPTKGKFRVAAAMDLMGGLG